MKFIGNLVAIHQVKYILLLAGFIQSKVKELFRIQTFDGI